MQFLEIYTVENQNKPIEQRGNEKSSLTQIKLLSKCALLRHEHIAKSNNYSNWIIANQLTDIIKIFDMSTSHHDAKKW